MASGRSRAEDELLRQRKADSLRRTAATAHTTAIPVISLKPFLENDLQGMQNVAETWDRACKNVGFLKVVDHGVPTQQIQHCWETAKHFFDRPLHEKRSVPMTDSYPYGYQGLGMENLVLSLDQAEDQNSPGDIKEMFNLCLGGLKTDDSLPTPQWPPQSEEMQKAWKLYYRALEGLAEMLYRVCALALSLPQDWFEKYIDCHRNVIRAISYPEQTSAPKPGQVRASTHTDYGALTLLRLGGPHSGGLQAMDRSGEWIPIDVDEDEDAFVVNLGDLMARWTNDRWLSTPHRVINPPLDGAVGTRQSIAYFCNINMNAIVECIPTCRDGQGGARYGPTTAGEHLMRKHQATVAGKLCYDAGVQAS